MAAPYSNAAHLPGRAQAGLAVESDTYNVGRAFNRPRVIRLSQCRRHERLTGRIGSVLGCVALHLN